MRRPSALRCSNKLALRSVVVLFLNSTTSRRLLYQRQCLATKFAVSEHLLLFFKVEAYLQEMYRRLIMHVMAITVILLGLLCGKL